MQVTSRKFQSLWVSASIAALSCTVPASADPLIDYWADQLTQGPSGPTYGELRQEFFGKIENARAAVNACGGCADAQAELDALLEEERQYQRMAGRALAMTGQPPAVYRLLGIQPPSFGDYGASFPSSYELGEGLVNTNPDWLNNAPEFCQTPVRDYLHTLKRFQDRAQSSEIDIFKEPGGELYDESRIYRACQLKDYKEFERLEGLHKARAAGLIIPEFEPIGLFNRREKGMIYYGDVPEDFMPPMVPIDVVKQSLDEEGYRAISIITNKEQDGNLIRVFVKPHSGIFLFSKSLEGCSSQYAERPERARRHCDDVNEIHRFKPYVLQCAYRETDNFGRLARRYAIYWYDERVELAKKDYLLRRDHNHPLLVIGNPRRSCPATWEQAWGELEAYQASLSKQRGRIAEIPMTRALPRSDWMLERIEAGRIAQERQRERMKVTDAYELSGYYALDYKQEQATDAHTASRGAPARPGQPMRPEQSSSLWARQSVAGDCIVAANPGVTVRVYQVACWSDSQVSVGRATHANAVTFRLAFMPSNQFLLVEDEADTLESDIRGVKITLRRKRDLVRMGEVPLEGDYLLQLAFGGEYLRAHCNFDYTSDRQIYLQLYCIDDQGRYLQSNRIASSNYPTAQMLPVSTLVHFPSWQAKFAGQARSIMLGGADLSKLFVMVDPVFEGDSLRDARLLLFGGVGITGSLQRIETSETTFGEDDPANVTGHWVGDFQCGQKRNMKADLYLQDEGQGRFRDVSGTFVFRDSRYGEERVLSHAVAGQYLSGVGSLKLEPGEWIRTVPQVGYESLGLRATAFFTNAGDAGGGARIQGDLTDKTCADIQLARVSRVVPKSITFESKQDVVSSGTGPDTESAPAVTTTATAGTAQPSSAGGAGPILELSADSFATGVTVPITVRRLPGNSQDWIAISRAGQADNQYVSYRYLGGATEGTWSLKSGPPGDYEVRVYLNWPKGGYNPVLRRPIKVVSREEAADAGLISTPKVHLASRNFAAGQPILVTVTGFPGNSQDWVAISKVGSADNTYKDYDYTGGVNEGTWTYTMNEPGEYEIRIYLNWPTGGYNPVLREKITVGAQR